MKRISDKEYEKYQHYQTDKLHGRILTPDGLRVICAGLDNVPEKIGIHMLYQRQRLYRTRCLPHRVKSMIRIIAIGGACMGVCHGGSSRY